MKLLVATGASTLMICIAVPVAGPLSAAGDRLAAPEAGQQAGRQAGRGARRGGGGGRFPRLPSQPFPTEAVVFETLAGPIRVVPMAAGLQNPWGLAVLPDGDLLVTERPGRLRVVRKGVLDPQPVSGVPTVDARGQGGLLEVALHPRFTENRWIYLTYSKAGEAGNTTALARGRFDGSALTGLQDLFVADAWRDATLHFGSKLAFLPDGTLLMTVGERGDQNRAQDLSHHAGKVLRLNDDGSVPKDNPFVGRSGARPEIYSYGHRNLQGLAVHPETGQIWETEHGPQGGDELNIIEPGRNYGWPIATFGREYTGPLIGQVWREGTELPYTTWTPSIGLSGLIIYTGDRLPGWRGNFFAGGLSGQALVRMGIGPNGPVGRETLLHELHQRIRDVRQGTDGLIYVVTDENPGGILRIEPAAGASDVH